MRRRVLGPGLEVGALGLGCMGMSDFYGPHDDDESLGVLGRALELGVTMFDTSDMYGIGANERLLGRWLPAHRDQVSIATKFGVERSSADPGLRRFRGEGLLSVLRRDPVQRLHHVPRRPDDRPGLQRHRGLDDHLRRHRPQGDDR